MELNELEKRLGPFVRSKYDDEEARVSDVYTMPGHAGFSYGFTSHSGDVSESWYLRLPPPKVNWKADDRRHRRRPRRLSRRDRDVCARSGQRHGHAACRTTGPKNRGTTATQCEPALEGCEKTRNVGIGALPSVLCSPKCVHGTDSSADIVGVNPRAHDGFFEGRGDTRPPNVECRGKALEVVDIGRLQRDIDMDKFVLSCTSSLKGYV